MNLPNIKQGEAYTDQLKRDGLNTGVFQTPRKREEPVFRSSLAMERDTSAGALHLAIMSTAEGAAKRKKAANNFTLFNQFNYMTEKQYEKANNRLIF